MENQCIVVTGLPGSGKSTIGKRVADAFDLDFLDKDDYLERLFRERGTGDSDWRKKLSRESDDLFRRDALRLKSAVLVSHWRPIGSKSLSGTPTEWLNEQFSNVVELYCVCSAEEAARRFINRMRHPGHLDHQRSPEEILESMIAYQRALPLSLGALECIETGADIPLDKIIDRLSKYVESGA